jgi:uracil-DNA glycosylase
MATLSTPVALQLQDLPLGWQEVIAPWWQTDQAQALCAYIDQRVHQGHSVYPAQVLRALHLSPLAQVKVVIVGQDPYHGPGQAQGLAFSVAQNQRPPPSLRNILTELQRDLGRARTNPDLSGWAQQGVLLLNTVFTVEQGQPASHAKRGWEPLSQRLVHAVAARNQPCVYMLWGAHAQQFEPLLADNTLACILKANHPSPLSARRPPTPFIGCGHFGLASRYLHDHGHTAIDWWD